jgi:hypothetical protein
LEKKSNAKDKKDSFQKNRPKWPHFEEKNSKVAIFRQ